MELKGYIEERVQWVDAALDHYLPAEDRLPVSLHQAMRYSVFAGGKRIRPVLMAAACEAVGGTAAMILPAACAMEMIHTYSLIHDDLPAMDDDDFRRGRPTNHKVFGEAIAILAGDALLTQAFALLSDTKQPENLDLSRRLRAIGIVATAAGSLGMVGGQVVDMEAEGKPAELAMVDYIHTHKTGALILASIQVGALFGNADEDAFSALTRYGEAIGLAFQIADDILDIVGEQEVIGKDVGSDQGRGKATYPALYGVEQSRRRAVELRDMAVESLARFGSAAQPLRAIAHYVVDRSS